ncbi:hypothetical protein ACO7_10082 [Thiomonas arsenitoxydans]|nr:hypothetical protein ACO3_10082 [Thiomonas arsenitoxydans]CQR28293.1 hypothetical protein ACO7_10082 [Thiomonas arsenitoxydans]CQR31037.1 hypothetical protein THICB6_150524 [Thiomonas arsenitoxydans]
MQRRKPMSALQGEQANRGNSYVLLQVSDDSQHRFAMRAGNPPRRPGWTNRRSTQVHRRALCI